MTNVAGMNKTSQGRRQILLPGGHEVTPRDAELFARHLASFVPPDPFDAHAHLYPLATLGIDFPDELRPGRDPVVGTVVVHFPRIGYSVKGAA